MKLRSIVLKNFRQHRHTTLDFPERGMVGLVGPNAVGKSTLIEAIAWAIYGNKATRGTTRGLRWKNARARQTAEVELCVDHNGHQYRFVRKETGAEVWEDNSEKPRAAGTDAVNQESVSIFGMTLEEFFATYFCTQHDLARIGKMGPTERTQFVLRVMQVEQIDRAIDEGRTRKNSLSSERKGILAGVGERDPLDQEIRAAAETVVLAEANERERREERDRAAQEETAAQTALETKSAQRDAHQALLARREGDQEALQQAERERTRVADEITRSAEAAERVRIQAPEVARLDSLRGERDLLLAARSNAERRNSLEDTIRSLARAVADLQEQELKLTATLREHDPTAREAAEASVRTCSEALQQLRSAREAANAVALSAGKSAAEQIKKAERKIEVLQAQGAGGECPTCRRALGAQFQAAIEALRADLQEAHDERQRRGREYTRTKEPTRAERETEQALVAAEQRFKTARASHDQAARATERLESVQTSLAEKIQEGKRLRRELSSLPAVAFDATRLERVEKEIRTLAATEQRLAADRALAERKEEIEERAQALAARHEQLAGRIRDASDEILRLGFDTTAYQQAQQGLEDARARNKQAAQALATASAERKAAEARLRRADQALNDYQNRAARADRMANQIKLLDETIDALLAFRRGQAEAIRPELQERTARYVSVLTDGRYPDISMDETFGIRLIDGSAEMEIVSGGSEDIAALATRLALGEMISERSGSPVSLLILDEPFASLAEAWRDNVVRLVRDLRDRFEQVICITHHTEVRDAVDIPYTVTFDEVEGASRLVA